MIYWHCAPFFAFTFKKLEPSDIFSPEIIEQEKVSEWAQAEIDLARQAGLLAEHTSDYMMRSITRFQFAELIVNLTEKVTRTKIVPAVNSTFTDNTETAAMIYRAIAYINAEATKPLALEKADTSKYTDQTQVSAWALEGKGALAANGIMASTSIATLSPCTVEQSILLVNRAYEKFQAAT